MATKPRHDIRENLFLALDTLRTHKFRAFLTILGVLIGTATVISVASIFKGLDQQMVEVAEGFGTRTLFIYKFEPGIKFHLTREERLRKPLTYEQAMAIKDTCPSVESVAVEIVVWGPSVTAKYKGQEMVDTNLTGATPEDFQNINAELKDGRLYTAVDNLHRTDVAVIGADVAERLYEGQDAIGKPIQVDGHTYEVIGTLGKRKAFLGDNGNDRVVYVPYFTYRKLYPNAKENFIAAMALPGKMDQAKDEITGLLRRLRNDKPSDPDSFGIASAQTIVTQFRDIMAMIVLVTAVISSIGLMVGGIGVMNIMLVSVTERTREIGVRKAIGARRSDITWQFLLEAMTLTATGGVLGILASLSLTFLIRALGWYSAVPLWSVTVGFVASVSIGLFFGMWPAMKASRLDPIVALRHE
ncbi:MAG: ABC transporter permease [Terriglobia bacterium]|jgi:ABC-type antimicrobial peptide transport system permease subunit